MVKLYEIRLNNFNEIKEETLHALWKQILHKDPWWHFFYEGTWTLLRVSTTKNIYKWLKKHKIEYEYKKIWKDNIPTTRKFQEEFLYIFHGYSELAMKNFGTTSKEIKPVLDRVVHCFMNNIISDRRRESVDYYADWEPLMIVECGIQRARTIGMILAGYYDKES